MRAGLLTGWTRSLSLFVVSIILAYLNYRGLTIVGRVAIGMTLFIILTFVVLICASIPHLQPRNWLVVDLPTVDWRGFINIMFWYAPARRSNLARLTVPVQAPGWDFCRFDPNWRIRGSHPGFESKGTSLCVLQEANYLDIVSVVASMLPSMWMLSAWWHLCYLLSATKRIKNLQEPELLGFRQHTGRGGGQSAQDVSSCADAGGRPGHPDVRAASSGVPGRYDGDFRLEAGILCHCGAPGWRAVAGLVDACSSSGESLPGHMDLQSLI